MKYRSLAVAMCVLLGLCMFSSSASTANPDHSGTKLSAAKILGTWEGESKCIAADSACHDEHVIYRIATIKHVPDKLALHTYKVLNGQLLFRGTIECVHPDQATLNCTGKPVEKEAWEFKIHGREMTGTLTKGEAMTPYRKINVKKK
jgi:hypothetical protein